MQMQTTYNCEACIEERLRGENFDKIIIKLPIEVFHASKKMYTYIIKICWTHPNGDNYLVAMNNLVIVLQEYV